MEQSASPLLSEQSGRQPLAAALAASDVDVSLPPSSVREVCVVPIAFVSDHVETLGEIDHEARNEAQQLGIHAV